ncbi:MAG: hypothetical protein ACYSSP_08740 [Planctomycetota bacterium]|jgi:hypothetical protein
MNDTEKIHKVWHLLEHNGKNLGHHITYLQFDEGVPYAVFEWRKTHEGEIPSKRIPLDPKHLRKGNFGKGADYLYEHPVVLPEQWRIEDVCLNPDSYPKK